MTRAGTAIARDLADAVAALKRHHETEPAEAESIRQALVAELLALHLSPVGLSLTERAESE